MKPLPIVATSAFAQVAPENPGSLREQVKALCANPPRRVNRLIELGLIGAHRCVNGRALPADTAIYMAFTSGCIADAASLAHNVVRGQPIMPVTFINVSSNMAGFYIAASLGLHSSNYVVASNDFAWEASLELALLDAAPGRSLLVGAVEECAWPLAEHRERLGLAPDTRLFETSQWLLADRQALAARATLHWVRRFEDDDALAGFLSTRSWPADTRLKLLGAGAEQGARLATQAGLRLSEERESEGYTSLPAAQACCRFVESTRNGALLHLNRGRGGTWYAVYLTAQA